MTWQIFLMIAIGAEVVGRLVQRYIMREKSSDPVIYTAVQQFIAGLILLTYAVILGQAIPRIDQLSYNLLLTPLIFGFGFLFISKGIKLTEASVFTILFALRALWIVIAAILILGENFTLIQFVGTFLILASVFMVSWTGQKIKIGKGEVFAILASIAIAVSAINDAIILRKMDVLTYSPYIYFSSSIFIFMIYPGKIKQIKSSIKSNTLIKLTILAFIFGLDLMSYLYAYKLGQNAAQIGSIYQISTVLTVIAAIFILKEKSRLYIKIIASVMCAIGVMLVT